MCVSVVRPTLPEDTCQRSHAKPTPRTPSSTPPGPVSWPTGTRASRRGRWPAQAGVPLSPGALPLRLQGRDGPGAAGSRGPAAPGPPDLDVRAGPAAVAALRAGLRLPRGRHRLRLRAGAAGDDRRRLVRRRSSPRRRGPSSRAGTACSWTSPTEAEERFGGLGPFSPQEIAALIVCGFIGRRVAHPARVRPPPGPDPRRAASRGRPHPPARGGGQDDGERTDACARVNRTAKAPSRAKACGISYEVFGDEPRTTTVLLVPTWSIMHSRFWKAQVPYLARHFRVVTFDGRGNGRSDRPPASARLHAPRVRRRHARGPRRDEAPNKAVLVGLSCGTLWNVQVAADHPERVLGIVAIGPAVPLAPLRPERHGPSLRRRLDHPRGLGQVQQAATGSTAGTTTSSASSSTRWSTSRTRPSRSRT